MFYHDLWEFVERKIAADANGGALTVLHPSNEDQMASTNGRQAHPDQAYNYLKRTNEIDQIHLLSMNLNAIIEDEHTPAEIKR